MKPLKPVTPKLSLTEVWRVSGRVKPFALAGPPHTDGVERTSRANIPGKTRTADR